LFNIYNSDRILLFYSCSFSSLALFFHASVSSLLDFVACAHFHRSHSFSTRRFHRRSISSLALVFVTCTCFPRVGFIVARFRRSFLSLALVRFHRRLISSLIFVARARFCCSHLFFERRFHRRSILSLVFAAPKLYYTTVSPRPTRSLTIRSMSVLTCCRINSMALWSSLFIKA
jgi:hypothetical protein